MSQQDISRKKDSFLKLVDRGRLHDAIRGLRRMSERQMTWEITDEISGIESAYRYMLKYAMDGVDDPHRQRIYDGIVARLLVVFDRLERQGAMMSADGRLYYSMARTMGPRAVVDAIGRYRERLSAGDAFTAALNGTSASTADVEASERELFNAVWTAYPLDDDSKKAVAGLLGEASVPSHVKRLTLSGVALGLLSFFDDARFAILTDAYLADDDEAMAMQALVGILLALFANRDRRMSAATEARIDALKEARTWRSDLKAAYLELIRTRDTERLTRKMTEEVVPEMLKMRPEITKRLGDVAKLDITEMEENPEWQEILDKSGLTEKLKELSEIQEEGGDVFMATFAHLKAFPFFYEISNWFLPFHADHSVVARAGDGAEVIAEMIAKAPMLCEGDKYSFMLALGSVATGQKEMMLQQLKAYDVSAAEIHASKLNLSTDSRRDSLNRYVRDLYRFFRLFRRRADFDDPFSKEINLSQISQLRGEFDDGETLQLVAEFYFKHKYYAEALGVFGIIDGNAFPDAQRYQKMGYCCQQSGDVVSAVKYYEQAELLNSRSSWTVKRLAACYRLLGETDKALECYRRLDEMIPDRFATITSMADCLTEKGEFGEAIKLYFKAMYLDENSSRPWRPLSWALMMTGDLKRSREYVGKLIAAGGEAVDYVNLGHINLLEHNSREAVNAYKTAIAMSPDGFSFFSQAIADDAPMLVKAGLRPEMARFVIDAVLYDMDSD